MRNRIKERLFQLYGIIEDEINLLVNNEEILCERLLVFSVSSADIQFV